MRVYEKEMLIPPPDRGGPLLDYFSREIKGHIAPDEIPVRFIITRSGTAGYNCEVGVLVAPGAAKQEYPALGRSIFEFRRRGHENGRTFVAALVIPTGIDCEIGGHSGDAGPVARLLGACCDHLVLHPNAVNASDINELPENALYVEGSTLTRLLMGTVGLAPARANRVLLVLDVPPDTHVATCYVNTFSAARAAMGMHGAGVQCLAPSFRSRAVYTASGRASGTIDNLELLFQKIKQHEGEFDVLALASIIELPDAAGAMETYFTKTCVNPWGGCEAMLTHAISHVLNIPSAHAPLIEDQAMRESIVGICDPRKSAEAVSWTDLFCILKGLHRSPRIITDPGDCQRVGVINVEDVSCLVQPAGCIGLPTLAALEQGITVIAVRENRNLMNNDVPALRFPPGKLFEVDNYLEAAGLLCAIRAGIDPSAVRRPLPSTRVWDFPPACSNGKGTRMEPFDPRQYLQEYFLDVDVEFDQLYRFWCRAVEALPAGGRALELGVGPSIYSTIPIAGKVDEIHLADLLKGNLNEIDGWIKKRPGHFDWKDHVARVLSIEGITPGPLEIERREAEIREKIRQLRPCDLRQDHPLGRIEEFDLVTAHYCTEAAARDKQEWARIVARVAGLVKPGGACLLSVASGLTISRAYDSTTAGSIPPDISAKDVLDAIAVAGLRVHSWEFVLGIDGDPYAGSVLCFSFKPRPVTPGEKFRAEHGIDAEAAIASELERHPRLKLGEGHDGWALMAREPVAKDTPILHIEGEQVTTPSRYTVQIEDNVHLGGHVMHLDDFTDHSCDPNCRLDVQGNQVHLVSVRRIDAGEKLTFNYLTTEWDMAEPFECKCGSANCFQHIAGFKHLPATQRQRLLPLLTPFLKQKMNDTLT